MLRENLKTECSNKYILQQKVKDEGIFLNDLGFNSLKGKLTLFAENTTVVNVKVIVT